VKQARALLARDHVGSDRLAMLFGPRYNFRQRYLWKASEDLVRSALERNPYNDVRGLACYWLADLLTLQAQAIREFEIDGPLETQQETQQRLTQLGQQAEDIDWLLLTEKPQQVADVAIHLNERVVAEFGNVPNNDTRYNIPPPLPLGLAAAAPLDELQRLTPGKPAPEIEGLDLDGRPLTLK
jgi:hypothetical protein